MPNLPTVYLVDPDRHHQQALVRLVESMGLQCAAYASGAAFLEALDIERDSVVILEIRIPDISGLQIQHRLTQLKALSPLIFVSAHATVPVAVRALRRGAVHFFERPYEENELWDAIQQALQLHRERRGRARQRAAWQERLSKLDRVETAVLGHLVDGRRNRYIADQLGLSLRTVETRRRRLMQKLEAESLFDVFRAVEAAKAVQCDLCGAAGRDEVGG